MGCILKYLANVTTLEYDIDKCTGCRRCVEVCPQGVFVMEGKQAAISDRDLCMECGACALNCEFGAIAVDSGRWLRRSDHHGYDYRQRTDLRL